MRQIGALRAKNSEAWHQLLQFLDLFGHDPNLRL